MKTKPELKYLPLSMEISKWGWSIVDCNGDEVALLDKKKYPMEFADFIVRSCNTHEELVDVAEDAYSDLEGFIDGSPDAVGKFSNGILADELRSVIAKAKQQRENPDK